MTHKITGAEPAHQGKKRPFFALRRLAKTPLAERIAVLPNTVSTWCTNAKQLSWDKLYAIADYLKVDVRELQVPNEKSPKKNIKL